jgi:hypothetical protein
MPAGPPPTMQQRVMIRRGDGRSGKVLAFMIWLPVVDEAGM